MKPDGFIHDHPQFNDLLAIVSSRQNVALALVEKDYWVTHALWAIQANGLSCWFKGGTSLSKGFGLIQRFSEDLDIKLDAPELPRVDNWTSEGRKATEARKLFFKRLDEWVHEGFVQFGGMAWLLGFLEGEFG